MQMASAVLANGKGSRLYKTLVRDRKTAQDIQFFSLGLYGVSMTGGWATARPEVPADQIETEFKEVIDGLASREISDDELMRARASVEREMIDHLMTVASRADWLSEHATVFGDPAKANDRLPALLSVTAKEIREVAMEVFRPHNRVTLIYIPQEKADS